MILPERPVNQALEANLKALFTRYPHERKRLEPILRRVPTKKIQFEQIDVPTAHSKPPIRILLLRGIGNPQFLVNLLNDQQVQKECFKVFIFENDPEFLAFCFQNGNMTSIINYPKTEWFLMHNEDTVRPALLKVLNVEGTTAMMLNVQALDVHLPSTPEISAYYQKLPAIYNEITFHVFHNHGNLEDSLLGLEVTLKNKEFLLHSPGIKDLKGYYDGCTALIVGAGPSLDHNLEAIKKYQDRFVIIAADAALKALITAGIRVDYTVSIERFNNYQKPFFEGLSPDIKTELVAFPVLHPDVIALYPGKKRVVYRNYSFFAYFEKMLPKGILRTGGSASHLGLRLADYMGCKKVLMVGLDSCYEQKDGLYRSHCSNTGYPEWGEFQPLEDFYIKRKHQPPMQAMNNVGEKVMTNITYFQWIKELSEELIHMGSRVTLINCSAIGLPMTGIPYVPLEKAAEPIDPIYLERPVAPEAEMNRSWDNKILKKNCERWLQLCRDASQEAEELLKLEQVPFERFEALLYIHAARLVIDDMFVAFVIQCCALDFFMLENEWFSYSLDHRLEHKEKIKVLKKRTDLFAKTLEWLVKIIETGGNSGIKVRQSEHPKLLASTDGSNNPAAAASN